jgi:hypothetical protein
VILHSSLKILVPNNNRCSEKQMFPSRYLGANVDHCFWCGIPGEVDRYPCVPKIFCWSLAVLLMMSIDDLLFPRLGIMITCWHD